MPEEILINSTIDNLPPNGALPAEGYLPMKNMTTLLTERVSINEFRTGTSQNFEWLSAPKVYNIGESVTRGGAWYQSLINGNTDVVPGTDPTKWQLIAKSQSGLVPWSAGVYPYDYPVVTREVNKVNTIYWLDSPTRPFVSSNFDAELAAGLWKPMWGKATVGLAFDAELTFDNQILKIYNQLNQSGPINFTLAALGNIPAGCILMQIQSDGSSPFNFTIDFDFIYGLNNGDALAAGIYEFYFLYKNGKVSVSVPSSTVIILPFFADVSNATIDDHNLIADSGIVSWDAKGTVAQGAADGEDIEISVDIVGATAYIMIGLGPESGTPEQADCSYILWANNPDLYYRFGIGGGANNSGLDVVNGDTIYIGRKNSGTTNDLYIAHKTGGIKTEITSTPGVTGPLWGHVYTLTPDAVITNVQRS